MCIELGSLDEVITDLRRPRRTDFIIRKHLSRESLDWATGKCPLPRQSQALCHLNVVYTQWSRFVLSATCKHMGWKKGIIVSDSIFSVN